MPNYTCEKCEKNFRNKCTYKKHTLRKVSCRKPLFICACNKRLVSKDSLRSHKRLYCKNSMYDRAVVFKLPEMVESIEADKLMNIGESISESPSVITDDLEFDEILK